MPLTDIQRRVMKTLAPFRSEASYVAGGAALNRGWLRLSDDVDIFQEMRTGLQTAVEPELQALRKAGMDIDLVVNTPETVEAIVKRYSWETRVQWFADAESRFRFFPVVADDELGFCLHPADNAINKVTCIARRQEAPRDAVDLMQIVQEYAPLGPLVWAATGKAAAINAADGGQGMEESPIRLLQSINANAFRYADEQIRTVRLEDGYLTREEVRGVLEPAFEAALAYCEDIAPPGLVGHLFVDQEEIPIAADADALEQGAARSLQIQNFSPTVTIK